MESRSKISIFFVLFLYSTIAAYSQCEIYLQKADALFSQGKCAEAKKFYEGYKECNPSDLNTDAKIAKCEECLKPPPRTHTVIGISNFSGYKSDEYKNTIIQSFTYDRRFIAKEVSTSRYGSNQTSDDIDYIISATSTLKQKYEKKIIGYINIPATKYTSAQSIPQYQEIPEIVEITIRITDAKTEQILVNQTENGNSIGSFIGRIWQQRCENGQYKIQSIRKKELEITLMNPNKTFVTSTPPLRPNTYEVTGYCQLSQKQTLQVYELNSYGSKNKIGEVRVIGSNGSYIQCKITDGAKEIAAKYNSGANIVIQR